MSDYGFCPRCGAPGQQRERRINGNDTCQNGHVYPSKDAVYPMTGDTTQEDVRLVADTLAAYEGVTGYYANEAFDRITTLLTAYESLGSPEYLAALVEEHEAWAEEPHNPRKHVTAHDNAERLREEGL